MTQEKIDRINYLARKSREQELTDAEKAEQAKLREGNSYAERILKSFGSGYAEKALALAKGYQRGEGDV